MTADERDEAALVASALEKLRTFVEDLPADERQVLAVLLAPAVAQAYTPAVEDATDVAGFGMGRSISSWTPAELPASLAARIRDMHWEVTVAPADSAD